MLDAIGVGSLDDLIGDIPPEHRHPRLNLAPGLSEQELAAEFAAIAAENASPARGYISFLGAGAYRHYIPSTVRSILQRGEFVTAYTPYQPEAAQGTLQVGFEFQTIICQLTGMEVANAGMYDGATSLAEAVLMAVNSSGKRRVLAASTLNPDYLAVLRTYLDELPLELIELPAVEGRVTADTVRRQMDDDTAAVVVQSPNIWGLIEDWNGCFGAAHEKDKTAAIAVFNPMACALLKKPGECGADIAAGEGQPLGVPLSFGGPYIGLFAATKDFVRRMPGRLIGRTIDADGRPAYCLTLQTREQHIRGAKATSNICTNQGLLALRATMYMTTLGKEGLRETAQQCYHKAHYLAGRIAELDGYGMKFDGPFFNEFCVTCPKEVTEIIEAAKRRRILAGIAPHGRRMGRIGEPNDLLIAVTEKRTKHEMDALVDVLQEVGE